MVSVITGRSRAGPGQVQGDKPVVHARKRSRDPGHLASLPELRRWFPSCEICDTVRGDELLSLHPWTKDCLEQRPFFNGEPFLENASQRRCPRVGGAVQKHLPRMDSRRVNIDMKFHVDINESAMNPAFSASRTKSRSLKFVMRLLAIFSSV